MHSNTQVKPSVSVSTVAPALALGFAWSGLAAHFSGVATGRHVAALVFARAHCEALELVVQPLGKHVNGVLHSAANQLPYTLSASVACKLKMIVETTCAIDTADHRHHVVAHQVVVCSVFDLDHVVRQAAAIIDKWYEAFQDPLLARPCSGRRPADLCVWPGACSRSIDPSLHVVQPPCVIGRRRSESEPISATGFLRLSPGRLDRRSGCAVDPGECPKTPGGSWRRRCSA